MRCSDLLQAIRTDLAGMKPPVESCRIHGGGLFTADISGFSGNSPRLYLSMQQLSDPAATAEGGEMITVAFSVLLLMADGSDGTGRHELLPDVLEPLFRRIRDNRWGLSGVGIPERMEAFPRRFAAADAAGLCVWEVSWRQKLSLPTENPIPDFLPDTVFSGFAPEVGNSHGGDYETVVQP